MCIWFRLGYDSSAGKLLSMVIKKSGAEMSFSQFGYPYNGNSQVSDRTLLSFISSNAQQLCMPRKGNSVFFLYFKLIL